VSGASGGFACNLGAFSADERARHSQLTESLGRAIQERRELDGGYAFRVGEGQEAFERAAEWIALENRCCPFLSFDLRWELNRPVWLSVTGPDGAKAFIAAEVGLE
jgi:hypothetical protein